MNWHIIRSVIASILNRKLRAGHFARGPYLVQALEQRLLLSGTNLLVNGDFESQPNLAASVDGFGLNGHGSEMDPGYSLLVGSQIPGWTIASGGATVHIASAARYPVIGGAYGVNVDGEGFGGNADLYQDFQTSDSQSYTLSFDWASWLSPGESNLSVTLTDKVTLQSLFSGSYAFEAGGGHVTTDFNGTGNPVRLEVKEDPASGTNDNDFNVDNFVVTASGGHLAVTTQPVDPMAGAKLAPVRVAILNDNGDIVDSSEPISVTLGIATASAVLKGTTTVKASAGVATFSNLSISAPGRYTLRFADGSGNTVDSVDIFVAGKAVFLNKPKDTEVRSKLAPPVRVGIVDANNKLIKVDNATYVTIELTGIPSNPPMTGEPVMQVTHGIATFSDLAITKAGTYTLTATPQHPSNNAEDFRGATISSSFKVTGQVLKFSKQPPDSDVNAPIAFAVAVVDSKGKVNKKFDGFVVVDIESGVSGYDPARAGPVQVVGGYATFAGSTAVAIAKAGTFGFIARTSDAAGGFVDDEVGQVRRDVKVSGLQLKFSQEPRDGDVNEPVQTAVAVLNSKGKVQKDFNGFVSIEVQGPAVEDFNAVVPPPVPVVGGFATFAGSTAITSDKAGSYNLVAKTTSAIGGSVDDQVEQIASRDFKLLGLHLKFSQEPKDTDLKEPVQVAVAVLNSKNKIVKNFDGHVSISIDGQNGNTSFGFDGPGSVRVVGGYATFADSTAFNIDKAGTYSMIARTSSEGGGDSDDDVVGVFSRQFEMRALALKFSKQPKDAAVNAPVEFAVAVVNSKGKISKRYNGFVNISIESQTGDTTFGFGGPTVVPVIAGFATFAGGTAFTIDKAGTYSMIARTSNDSGGDADDGVVGVFSSQFRISGT